MDLRERAARLAERLASAGVEAPQAEAWLLLAVATGRARAAIVADPRATLSAGEAGLLEALAARRVAREPMAQIVGHKEFWSLTFAVGPAVLVPRPETETLIEAALEEVPGRAALRILDLGTGSGCLLLALLTELPAARGFGVDVCVAALAVAASNARRLGLAARASFVAGNWGAGLAGSFDLIVTNPPYVSEAEWPGLQPEIREFEPRQALVAGADGLDAYRALAPDAARLLAPHGVLAVEIGEGQGAAVTAILARHSLTVTARRADLAGITRCLSARRSLPTAAAGAT